MFAELNFDPLLFAEASHITVASCSFVCIQCVYSLVGRLWFPWWIFHCQVTIIIIFCWLLWTGFLHFFVLLISKVFCFSSDAWSVCTHFCDQHIPPPFASATTVVVAVLSFVLFCFFPSRSIFFPICYTSFYTSTNANSTF